MGQGIGGNPAADGVTIQYNAQGKLETIGRPVPAGGVIEWDGTLATIPNGFVLCDGNNGTVNRLDKYMKSVPNGSTNPGGTGGANTHTLTVSEIPPHPHVINISDGAGGGSTNMVIDYHNQNTPAHTIDTLSTGGGNAHNNEPAYLTTAYIMKT